ncbi:MAG: hypothetical protein AB8G11_17985 [Saprospiraceae bacterium]
MKNIFIHGIVAGVLSALAGVIYFNIYQTAFGTAFDSIINIPAIIGASIFGCMLMAVGYFLLFKFKKENLTGILNVIIAILSFASIISPIGMSLPLDIDFPEMFPGLVVPMHFFPALAFFAIAPFFQNKN